MKRFWDKVDKSGDCWPWQAGTDDDGYGRFQFKGKCHRAHRFAWALSHGPIPDGMHALHRCDNPPCCNPAHLFLGTSSDNMRDKVAKGRLVASNRGITHCKRGHEFTPENTRHHNGGRWCRKCDCLRSQAYRARLSARQRETVHL